VAYASKTGFTAGIAEFIGEKLRERDMSVEVEDIDKVEDLRDYDAFVIGSAAYMFHWLKEAKEFVSKNRGVLATRPVWLFSSGPVGAKKTDDKGRDLLESSVPKDIENFQRWINPRGHQVFFGGLDGSRLTGATGFWYKVAMKSEKARESMPEGDFRDWNAIGAWASSVADALQSNVTSVPNPAG